MNTPLEQYHELEAGLLTLIPKVKFSRDINLRLERIERLLEILGNPHHQFASVHVGGSAGKGSTSTMIASLLTAAGYKTGLHVSPHLQLINERHQVDGVVAPTSVLLALFEQLLPACMQVADELPYGPASYFEAQFALSCLYFAQQQVDVAVVEVGLGGTRDATNVLPSKVAVLTSVGLDHTEVLGDTIELIISDKAGIIKPNQRVVTGVTQPSAREIIWERSTEFNNEVWLINEHLGYTVTDATAQPNPIFTVYVPTASYENLQLQMVGEFQMANAAVAVAAATAFVGRRLSDEVVRKGLQSVRFPGRAELIQEHPLVVLDGAHNPDKMRAAAETLPTASKTIVVFGLKAGKDLADILPSVLQHADVLVVTEFVLQGLWEPVPAEEIVAAAVALQPDLDVRIEIAPLDAVEQALNLANDDDLVWITGSLYLIGNVRGWWYSAESLILAAEKGLPATLRPLTTDSGL